MITENTKPLFDAAAIVAAIGSLLNYLPLIAAAASLVWTLIRIWETKTVQGWLGNKT